MLKICEVYAEDHNLKFNTDKDPRKRKTKCLASRQKTQSLTKLFICGNPLPWVISGKQLDSHIENKINGQKLDIMIKRAKKQ